MKSAEALNLRSQLRTPRSRHAVFALLALGLLAVAASRWLETSALDSQLKLQQEQGEEMAFLLERQAQPKGPVTPTRDKATTDIQQRLSVSWTALLQAMDQAAMPKVSLLSFTPEADAGRIRLQVEAEDLAIVLQYIDRLEASPVLAQVHLVHQQLATTGPAATGFPAGLTATNKLRFTILANWVQP